MYQFSKSLSLPCFFSSVGVFVKALRVIFIVLCDPIKTAVLFTRAPFCWLVFWTLWISWLGSGYYLRGLVSGISLLRGSLSLRKALYPYLWNNSSASFCSSSDSSPPHVLNRYELGNSFLTTLLSFFTSGSCWAAAAAAATGSFCSILFIRLTNKT